MSKRLILVLPIVDGERRKEAIANETITPGLLVERLTTGKLQKNDETDDTGINILVAIENELCGKEISTDYASGDAVQFIKPLPGDEVNLILADGEEVVIGDTLRPTTAGEIIKCQGDSAKSNGIGDIPYFEALEAIDASDSAVTPVADRRILVEVL